MSNQPSISEYAKYADLQMAAEAFLKDELMGDTHYSGDELVKVLKEGNRHSSLFTEVQVIAFEKDWEVLSQELNTNTGFSGTLLRNKQTQELVMSFRSIEFVDDSARDNQATNVMEIAKFGFAFGQLRDMEVWYQKLHADGLLTNASQLTVTGYSLGEHLATAFNLMHASDLTDDGQSVVERVFTFNGAGISGVDPNTDPLTIVKYRQQLQSAQCQWQWQWSGSHTRGWARPLYKRTRQSTKHGGTISSDECVKAQSGVIGDPRRSEAMA